MRVSSVLGPGIVWKGNLGGSGGIRIEGAFEGDIHLRGVLVVGENGRVTCDEVRAQTVIVGGALRGNITAEKVEIRATGRVWGNIHTVTFATEVGAFLRGQITMEERIEIAPPPEAEPETPPRPPEADAATRPTPVPPEPEAVTRPIPVITAAPEPEAATRPTPDYAAPAAPEAAPAPPSEPTPAARGNTLPGRPRTPTALEPPLADPLAATRAQRPLPERDAADAHAADHKQVANGGPKPTGEELAADYAADVWEAGEFDSEAFATDMFADGPDNDLADEDIPDEDIGDGY